MRDPKDIVLRRTRLCYYIVLGFGILVLCKAAKIQIKEKDALLERASKRELRIRDEKAHRGNVFSKNGTLLATSVPKFTIHFDPLVVEKELFDKELPMLSDSLSRLLKTKSKSQFVSYLKKERSLKNLCIA